MVMLSLLEEIHHTSLNLVTKNIDFKLKNLICSLSLLGDE